MPTARENVKMTVKGKILTIEINLDGGGEPTKTSQGRNLAVASTGGFVPVMGSNVKVSINAIKPAAG